MEHEEALQVAVVPAEVLPAEGGSVEVGLVGAALVEEDLVRVAGQEASGSADRAVAPHPKDAAAESRLVRSTANRSGID
jgi:hypothetical protein